MTEKMTPEKYAYYLYASQDPRGGCPYGFKSLGPGFERYSEHHSVFFGTLEVCCYHCGDLVSGRAGAYPVTTYYTRIDHWNKVMEENKPKENKMKTIEEIVKIYNDAVANFAGKECEDTEGLGNFVANKDNIKIILKHGPGYTNTSYACKEKCSEQGFVIEFGATIHKKGTEFYLIPLERVRLYVPKIKVKNWKTGKEYEAEFHEKYVKFGCAKILNTDIVDALTHIESFRQLNEYKSPTGMVIGDGIFTTEILHSLKEQIQNNKK